MGGGEQPSRRFTRASTTFAGWSVGANQPCLSHMKGATASSAKGVSRADSTRGTSLISGKTKTVRHFEFKLTFILLYLFCFFIYSFINFILFIHYSFILLYIIFVKPLSPQCIVLYYNYNYRNNIIKRIKRRHRA